MVSSLPEKLSGLIGKNQVLNARGFIFSLMALRQDSHTCCSIELLFWGFICWFSGNVFDVTSSIKHGDLRGKG